MPTIPGTLRMTAARVPAAEALAFEGASSTYRELDEAVDRMAAVLADAGLRHGDRFALMAPNSDGFVLAFYAALRLGAIVVPVNPSLAPPEVGYLLADSGARAFAFAPSVAATVDTALAADRPADLAATFALGAVDGHPDLMALAAAADAVARDDDVREDDDALILYTSGTTGRPKGALFDHHRVMWVAVTMITACGMRAGDRFLHVAPLYHAAELNIMLVPGTMLGAKHVVLPRFDPGAVLEAMERERITMFFGVPTMFQFLLRHPDVATRDLVAWRTGLFGAAPMPPTAVQQLVGTLPHVEFMQLCGQTEGGPGGIYSTAAQVAQRPDSSGHQALPFTEVRIADLDGEPVAPGGVGEMLLRGDGVMKQYWRKPEATAEALRGGWLHTGDLTRLDADGAMTIVDRLKDMIITGGHNVYSVEVEAAVAAHPDVLDCAVVARPHPDYGESIVAVVTPREDATLTLEDLRTFCAGRIADFKLPHDLVIAPIPRNPSGKILKHQLRAAVTQETEALPAFSAPERG
jgi:acyl-CoA synthetase (AMP-forming)/AMP-acid ligase II